MGFKAIDITIKVVASNKEIDSKEAATLIAIASFADNKTGRCWPKRERLSEITKFSGSTITRAIAGLVKKGLLVSKGGRSSNYYTLPFLSDNYAQGEQGGSHSGDGYAHKADREYAEGRVKSAHGEQQNQIEIQKEKKKKNRDNELRGAEGGISFLENSPEENEQFARDVIAAYNQTFNGLLPPAEYDKDLGRKIIGFRKDYLKDKSITGFIAYFEAFKNTASDFYFGNGFTATLDFLLKPKTLRDTRAGAL
ncbi:helix-turn-helix domain-containing protein [Escherichia coli]|uniref:helix-turn-helix domain-containing protein n=1 Tax=Escherichia coli TaxID=562 RepID=UPI0039A6D2D3